LISKRFKNDDHPVFKMNKIQQLMKSQIQTKLSKGIYSLERIPCVVCNQDDFEELSQKDRYGLPFSVCVCCKCGLVQTMPRMTQDSYDQFYNEEYHKLNKGKEVPDTEYFDFQYKRGKEIYEYLDNQNKAPHNAYILEVGCGSGGILHYLQKHGNHVVGVDIGSDRINYGKDTYNLDLHNLHLKDFKPRQTPDLIILSHIVEHFTSPLKELNFLTNLITPQTQVLILLPGIKKIENSYEGNLLRYLQFPHTYHFTLTTLTNLMSLAGYKLICGNEDIFSIFHFSEEDQKVIFENDYEPVKKFLNQIESKLWS
jgi:SAM-dependent methyltransferase